MVASPFSSVSCSVQAIAYVSGYPFGYTTDSQANDFTSFCAPEPKDPRGPLFYISKINNYTSLK